MDIFRGHYSAFHNQFSENWFCWLQHEACYFLLPTRGQWNVASLAAAASFPPMAGAAVVPRCLPASQASCLFRHCQFSSLREVVSALTLPKVTAALVVTTTSHAATTAIGTKGPCLSGSSPSPGSQICILEGELQNKLSDRHCALSTIPPPIVLNELLSSSWGRSIPAGSSVPPASFLSGPDILES